MDTDTGLARRRVFRLRAARAAVLFAAALAPQFAWVGEAHADASCDPGDICFYDFDTSRWGSLSGTNSSWYFGAGNDWNYRADYFYNNGLHCSSRVYYDSGFSGGVAIDLDRGSYEYSWDTGASNDWYDCH